MMTNRSLHNTNSQSNSIEFALLSKSTKLVQHQICPLSDDVCKLTSINKLKVNTALPSSVRSTVFKCNQTTAERVAVELICSKLMKLISHTVTDKFSKVPFQQPIPTYISSSPTLFIAPLHIYWIWKTFIFSVIPIQFCNFSKPIVLAPSLVLAKHAIDVWALRLPTTVAS